MHVENLVALVEGALASSPARTEFMEDWYGRAGSRLIPLYSKFNGFFALDRALHVFPVDHPCFGYSLREWNSRESWPSLYHADLHEYVFFAENTFGEQYAIDDDSVYRFDPETAELHRISNDIESWSEYLLINVEEETGVELARKWQKYNRPLLPNERLVPTIPFVAGGEYSLNNLHVMNSLKGMEYRASLSNQIADLPEGTKIELRITE